MRVDQKKWRMPTSKPFDLPPASYVPFGAPVPCGETDFTEKSPLSRIATVPYIAVRFDRLYWYVAAAFQTEFDLGELAKSRPDLVPLNWEAPSYLKGPNPGSAPQNDPWQRLTVDELNERLDGFLKH